MIESTGRGHSPMTQKVMDWAVTTPTLRAYLTQIAEGDRFNYGDDDLAEMVMSLLHTEPDGITVDLLTEMGVSRENAREVGAELERTAQDPPYWVEHIDWQAVRSFLIGENA